MKVSMKKIIRAMSIIMVVIVYITTIILSGSIIDTNKFISKNNIIVLAIFILISYIFSVIISNKIVTPLKKIEKGMKVVSEGKLPDISRIKDSDEFTEYHDIMEAYIAMLKVIKKNTFDLNSQQSKTEIILEHMADGVMAFSTTKEIVHMNKTAMRLLNITDQEETFDTICQKLELNVDFSKIMYLPNYQSVEIKTQLGELALSIVFAPFFSDELSPMGLIMIIRNITDSVKTDNVRKEFVANVSHELKTPLTSIRGYSETIMNGDLTYQEIIKFSKVINQEANRMSRLVSDLLQLSKMDYNKVNWNKVTLNTVDVLKKVCEKVRFEAEEKNHKLELICAENTPTLYADKDSIEQIVINILTNSIKYTPEGGLIRIYAGPIDDRVYIKVIDNGIGIPQKDLGRIFERFYRVDKARSRKMGGTGLGLSIVKDMVDGNNGTINIDSKLNEGTEVTMTFPTKKE
jgi:two-component system sensor histidine kinase VicK